MPANTDLIMTPGDNIKTLGELNELTQEDLTSETGIPQTTISAIESGRTKLEAERAKVFAAAFNVHPVVILFSDWRGFCDLPLRSITDSKPKEVKDETLNKRVSVSMADGSTDTRESTSGEL